MPRISTEKSNKKLRLEYKLRFLTTFLFGTTISGVLILLFILPSYTLLSFYGKSYQNSEISPEQRNVQAMNEEYRLRLDAAYELSQNVDMQKPLHLNALKKINEYANGTIIFNAVELLEEEDGIGITLRGQSLNREALLSFEGKIQGDSNFSGFKIPIDALTKQSNISFNVSFKYYEK
jgi:hypothetical protein